MAWYPGAIKMELQPESDAQPAIRPTQFIVHSIVAPWTPERTYEHWKNSTNLESHFGLGYDGRMGQYIGTETRADANAAANRRPDGTGAVSIETASNTSATDPWTPEQVEALVRLGVWLHRTHGIPLRVCRSHSDPGYGYHSLHREWSTSGTACPGRPRIAQFRDEVFPAIVARASGASATPSKEDDMPSAEEVAAEVWRHRLPHPRADITITAATLLRQAWIKVERTEARIVAQAAVIEQLAAALAAHHQEIDPDGLIARIEAAIEGITVRLDVQEES
ncbi:peptidoglycan recognition protein family protein [Streptomyces aidingensis]|uniref:N-acetylmuramoyl-L-alanine amidase n=1 Tax=Streptomyces aidingensis TaxID=910347 RepID=A0A1I1PXC1_9ACTN|nr:N-acetylmuramoyl-L-alanine amidase [Streptomyces aidingensis]SFD14544.1 N-acetylmuramoyl-L-alanine amidase [Streptomyces aidingensis]